MNTIVSKDKRKEAAFKLITELENSKEHGFPLKAYVHYRSKFNNLRELVKDL